MSSATPDQSSKPAVFRLLGGAFMVAALLLILLALLDMLGHNDPTDPQFGHPDRFWMFFVGVPFFFVGGVCLNIGFSGAVRHDR